MSDIAVVPKTWGSPPPGSPTASPVKSPILRPASGLSASPPRTPALNLPQASKSSVGSDSSLPPSNDSVSASPEQKEVTMFSVLEKALEQQMKALQSHTEALQASAEALQQAQSALATISRMDVPSGSPSSPEDDMPNEDEDSSDDFCILPHPKDDPATYLPEPKCLLTSPANKYSAMLAPDNLMALGIAEFPQLYSVTGNSDGVDLDGRSKLEQLEFKVQVLQKYKQSLKLKEQEFVRTVETLMQRCRKYVDVKNPHPVNKMLTHLLETWQTYRYEDADHNSNSSAFEQLDEAELDDLDALTDDIMQGTSLRVLIRRLESERRRLEGSLPAYGHRTSVLKALITTKILIVKGSVCAGHRFLIPQLVMEALPSLNASRVICCTYSEVAAALLAYQASRDIGCKVGTAVGLLVGHSAGRLKSIESPLLYTTAFHLCALLCDPENVTAMRQACVVVDAVDMHTWQTDLLLSMLKLQQRRNGLRRIVLLSCNTSSDAQKEFYRRGGRTVSEVEVVCPLGNVPVVWQEKEMADVDLCTAAVRMASTIHTRDAPTGDILVFVPTPYDTHRCVELFNQQSQTQPDFPEYNVLAFHELSSVEIWHAVLNGGSPNRQVIFATSIAEMCGPLPHVMFIVDTGKAMSEKWDAALGTTVQRIGWISKRRCAQRSLLCASRIEVNYRCFAKNERHCVRLFTRAQFEEFPLDHPPGLQCSDLTMAVLILLAFGVDDVCDFETLVPMPHEALKSSLENARRIGAMKKGKMTDIGAQLIVRLGLQPNLARFLMEGTLRKCQLESVTLVCLLNKFTPMNGQIPGDSSTKRKTVGPKSQATSDNDLMTLLRLFQQWQATAHRDRKASYRDTDLVTNTFLSVEKAVPVLWNHVNHLSPSLTSAAALKRPQTVDGLLHNSLCEMLMTAFPRHLAVFTGHKRSGYRLGVEGPPQYAHIHVDSVVTNNGQIWPRWIIYCQLLSVDGDLFVRHVCCFHNVDEVFTQLEARPTTDLNVNFLRSLENEVVSKVTVQCGVEQVLRKVVGDKRSGLTSLEGSISRTLGCLCVIDTDRRLQALLIHVPFRFHRQAAELGRAAVAQAKQALRDEDLEALLGTQNSGIRLVLAGGALARTVLMPSDYRALRVCARRLHPKGKNSTKPVPGPQQVTPGRFRRFWQSLFGGRGHPKSTEKRPSTTSEAMAESVDGDDACTISDEEWLRRSMPLYLQKYGKVQVSDVTKGHNCAESRVMFQSADDARNAFWDLNNKCDEGFLLQLQPEHWREMHSDVTVPTEVLTESKVYIRLYLYWAPSDAQRPPVSYTPQPARIKTHLRTLLTSTNSDAPEDINVLKTLGYSGHAYAEYAVHATAVKVQRALNGRKLMLEGVERTLTTRVESACCIGFLKEVYAAVETTFQPVLRQPHVEAEVIPGPNLVQVVLRCNNVQQLYQVRQQLYHVTQGDPYITDLQSRVVLRRLFGPWGTQLVQKVREDTKAFIHLDPRLRTVCIYGTDHSKSAACRMLNEALGQVSTKLVGHLQPTFIKYLLKSYGYHLEGLRMACNAVSVGVRGTSILLEGEEASLQSALQIISTEQAVLSQVPTDASGGSSTEKCAICSDALGADCMYPSLCGHGHCLECMQAHIHTAISERKLPLTCGFWDCDSFIAIRDVQSICDETQWAQVVEMATAALAQACSDQLQFCPTPGCPALYWRPRDRGGSIFQCPECGRSICTSCSTDAHPGMACNQLPQL